MKLFVRRGRGLVLTEAGRALRPEAENVLHAVDQAAASVAEVRELRGGTAAFGTFGSATYYLLADYVDDFRRRHPDVRLRVVGQNSSEVADAVRAGRLEAGLIVLPVDDEGLEVRPAITDELLYLSADQERVRRPVTIEAMARAPTILYDARFGWEDPTRRQLHERAQHAGVRLQPTVEIEDMMAAIDLAARGVGDTFAPRAIVLGRRFPRKLRTVPFDPPLYDTFAFIHRRGERLSPAARELIALAERHIGRLGRRLAEDMMAADGRG